MSECLPVVSVEGVEVRGTIDEKHQTTAGERTSAPAGRCRKVILATGFLPLDSQVTGTTAQGQNCGKYLL